MGSATRDGRCPGLAMSAPRLPLDVQRMKCQMGRPDGGSRIGVDASDPTQTLRGSGESRSGGTRCGDRSVVCRVDAPTPRGEEAIVTAQVTGSLSATSGIVARRRGLIEVLVVLAYFGLVLAMEFARLDGEWMRWITLVIVPLALMSLLARTAPRPGGVITSVGLARGHMRDGLGLAIAVGVVVSPLFLLTAPKAGEVLRSVMTGRIFFTLPIAIVLLLLTAASTEEFFFRGVLLTRCRSWLGSDWLAICISAVCFGLYHLPYAALDLGQRGGILPSWLDAFGVGTAGGLVLGWVFVRARGNLVASIVAHALMNALVATTVVHINLVIGQR